MTDTPSAAPAQPEKTPKDPGRAGRNLPVAIASGVVLAAAIILSLAFWSPAFMLIVVRGRRGGDLGDAPGAAGPRHRHPAGAVDARRRGDGGGRLPVRCSRPGHGDGGDRAGDDAVAAAAGRRRLRAERDRLGVHADLHPVPRLVRGAAARRGRGRQGGDRLHRGDGRLRHRGVRRRGAVRQAPDGAGHLAEEVVGGLRRIGGRLRRGGLPARRTPARRRLVGRRHPRR